MSLTQKYSPLPPFSNPNPKSFISSSPKPFDQALIRRLTSLLLSLPKASAPSVPLSFLVQSVDLLTDTLTSFSSLLADPSLSRSQSDIAALSSHLDASVALLDSANSLTAAVDRISRLRLHLAFALHLLANKPHLAFKARDSLSEWRRNFRAEGEEKAKAKPPSSSAAKGLVRSDPPRGSKISAVHRAIYAVESVSALVVALVASFLGERADLESIRVPKDFSWAEAFNAVLTAVSGRVGGYAAEIEAVDQIVEELTASIDDAGRLKGLTEVAEKRTEDLTEGLDRLGNAVSGMFRAALCSRNVALQGFRIAAKNCK